MISEVPARVVQLTQLVCLRVGWMRTRVPNGFGKTTSLQQLSIRLLSIKSIIVLY
uniref:Disease resistance R13L4/SHOC-2-like LRR domain-containing protein n=1 Tax=Arundo donax TaxID=35708 RepID=A0A0A9FBS2_ARUDO